MKLKALLVFWLLLVVTDDAQSQWSIPSDTTTIYLRNESGVVIGGRRPPDSLIIPGKLLLRFKQGKVDYEILNETFVWWNNRMIARDGKGGKILSGPGAGQEPELRWHLFRDKFYLDSASNIVTSPALKNALLAGGGKYLRRLTGASPGDSLSITRTGDTISCDHYNWFVLETDSSVNPLVLTFLLMQYHRADLILAHPDYRGGKFLRDPVDTKFPCENKDTMIRLTRAWDFETGVPQIRVGIYDDGIDFRNPDLGIAKGHGNKVEWGWDYIDMDDVIEDTAQHGTRVAGIIGAFTNNFMKDSIFRHVAGIAGGWGLSHHSDTIFNRPTRGATLVGFATEAFIHLSTYMAAMFEASAQSMGSYGLGVHVMNTSATVLRADLSPGAIEPLTAAVNYAFENGVVVVAARDNMGNTSRDFPACVDEPWVINVSGSIADKTKTSASSFGHTIDLLAPSGDNLGCDAPPTLHWTTQPINNAELFGGFAGNSAACAAVSGSAALILSHFHKNQPKLVKLEPEDVAGILKASSFRVDADRDTSCSECWRPLSGWGHLEIGKAMEMLDTNLGEYEVRHFHVSDSLDSPGDWSDKSFTLFDISWAYSNEIVGDLAKFKHREYLVSKNYYESRHRVWTKTVTLPSIWQVSKNNPLFAWGRSGGLNEKSGWSFAQQNLQTGWTQVTSSTGGDSLNEGIFHSHNDSSFTLRTVQYEVKINDSTFLRVPSDSMMGMNFSVFGRIKQAPLSVRNSSRDDGLRIRVFEYPSGLKCQAYLESSINNQLDIFDLLGRLVTSQQIPNGMRGWTTVDLSLAEWPSGSYFVTLRGRPEAGTAHFTLRK